jgi:hypothetical protein
MLQELRTSRDLSSEDIKRQLGIPWHTHGSAQWVRGRTPEETFSFEELAVTRMVGFSGGPLESFMEILLDPCS